MATPKSPFAVSSAQAGSGEVVLSLLPPGRQVLQKCMYQYPLKLIAPDPHRAGDGQHVTVVFLLTYGGGLVGGDQINLTVDLHERTQLVLVTQGSTKIFKSPERSVVSQQILDVKIGRGASLCYLPDPTQPFAESVYEQKQTFYVDPEGKSSLLVLDWVTEGRRARGESWTLWGWKGRNEVREWDEKSSGKGRLLLRDAVSFHGEEIGGLGLAERSSNMGLFGTLIVYGPVFEKLGKSLMREFAGQPRIGAKTWNDSRATNATDEQAESKKQHERQDGLLWTAASVRGFVLVKFGAREIDGARQWLRDLLSRDGTVEQVFGHQALICLR